MKARSPVRRRRVRRPYAIVVVVVLVIVFTAQPVILGVCGVDPAVVASCVAAGAVALRLARLLLSAEG